MQQHPSSTTIDFDRFRLRRLVERMAAAGEVDVRDDPIDLVDMAGVLDGNLRAVWFEKCGPEQAAVVGNVMGSRRRIALALETDEAGLPGVFRKRLETVHAPIEVSSSEAPVHQVILTGDSADFTRLPVHLQHGRDGGPYISAGIDFVIDPATGWTNVGIRRLMVRGRQTAGIDLNAPSDLRAIYLAAVARGERLPVAFAVGSHPVDFLGAMVSAAPTDELALLGSVRGMPVPTVKCVTSDIRVPADAEYILEGYLDERGLVEPEGPYGEYLGYYGLVKRNPLFHLTAITHRRDALFQTVTIGGRWAGRTDTALIGAIKTEATVWQSLRAAVREPVAVCCTATSGGMYNVRVSLRQRVPGEARNAIAAVFASLADVKHVFVVDEDVDVFSDEQIDWALATRFQADQDFVVASGFRAVPLDPSLQGKRQGAKAGFDCTRPFGKGASFEYEIPMPPVLQDKPRSSVEAALTAGPHSYLELMEVLGTRDGREVAIELERIDASGRLTRLEDGRYRIV
jgi:UbiD family decarboxylase